MHDGTSRGKKRTESKPTSTPSLQDRVRTILVRKRVVLITLFLSLGASIWYLRTTPPVYRSELVLVCDDISKRLPITFLRGTDTFGRSFVSETNEIQQLVLKSDPVLAEIKQQFSEKCNSEITLGQLKSQISMSGKGSIMVLAATAGTPKQAQTLANIAGDVLVKKTTEMERADLRRVLAFLREQMERSDREIEETEQALNDYRAREGLVFPISDTASSGLLGRLGYLQGELLKTESDIELVKSQLQSIERLISERKNYAQSSSFSFAEVSPQIDQLQDQLTVLRSELNMKVEVLPGKHPEVIALQKKVDVVRTQLEAEFSKLLEEPGIASIDPVSESQGLAQQFIALNTQLRGLERKAALLTEKIGEFEAEHPEIVSKHVELMRLERRARVNEQAYIALMSKYEDMSLMEQMKTSKLRIINTALLPKFPIAPSKKRVLAFGIMAGLSVGIGLAFLLEYLDDSIKRTEDVERFLQLPVIGMIPIIESFDLPENTPGSRGQLEPADNAEGSSLSNASEPLDLLRDQSKLPRSGKLSKRRRGHGKGIRQDLLSHSLLYASSGSPKAPEIENYWALAINIKYANMDRPIKSLLVTSAMPEEGKTTVATNLAIVMAQSGMKVLLIDADLRRPSVHHIFQQDRASGLSDLLLSDDGMENMASDSALRGFIRPTTVDNLYLLPGGIHVSNPGILFPSRKMHDLIESLAQQHDLLIFDSPPLGAVADALALSTEVDGTLMVIYSGKTKRRIGLQSKESLESVNGEVLGVVLNNVDYAKEYGSSYYYHYGSYDYSGGGEEE